MDIRFLITAGIMAVILIAIIGWQASINYGQFVPSKEVTTAYESFSVDPDLN